LFPPVVADEHFDVGVKRADGDVLYVGSAVLSTETGPVRFLLTRHKPSGTGADDPGFIFVSTGRSSFIKYYRTIVDPDDDSVEMVRADGTVLVRYPGQDVLGHVLSASGHFRRSIARNPDRGTYDAVSERDGIDRLFAYRKVGNYPVYVTVGLKRSAVIDGWLRLMASHLIFGVPATLCLMALTFVALRRSEAADRATATAHAEAERRKTAEESLRHAQRMEAVGRMTGGVAHDFNNLLTVVTGNLDMILRRPQDGARVQRLAEAALRATTRGERLTQQLLMFSRRQVMRPETSNLNRLLIEFDALLRRAAGERVDLRLQLDPALDPSRIDRTQFEAAILNLVVNARDALTDGGRIVIETQNAAFDESYARDNPEVMPGAYVVVAVSDNGCGIPKADLSRVFEPFFTTKEIGKGSGLGLSQVYGFAKESGGHVRIYSEPNVGTTIRLYLPKSSDRPSEAVRRDLLPLRSTTGGETILVVEDDAAVLSMAVESLGELGYRVLVAHNGREALDILKGGETIDILFSDVVMPGGINGGQLAIEARRVRPTIKVLLTSGYTGAALGGAGGLPEDMPVLGKPYRRDELAAQLRMIIGGRGR
jgi:signal transduction histidine kinase